MGFSLSPNKKQPTQILKRFGTKSVITLDATVKEDYTTTAEPTQHPVEKGSDLTDHIILKPDKLSISGIITATPFPSALAGLLVGGAATVTSSIGKALGPFGGAAGAVVGAAAGASIAGSIFGSNNRDLGSIATEFKALKNSKQVLQIVTGLKTYTNYVLVSAKVGRTDKTGGSITVDLEFSEISVVDSQTTTAAIPKKSGGIPGQNKGNQSKAGLTDDENSQGSSLLKKLFGQG